MPICAGVNFTDLDLYYYGKMQHEKSWAWWLNNLGRTMPRTHRCSFGLVSRNLRGVRHRLLRQYALPSRSLPTTYVRLVEIVRRPTHASVLLSARFETKLLHAILDRLGHRRHGRHFLRRYAIDAENRHAGILPRSILVLTALDELRQYKDPHNSTLIQHTDISCKSFNYVRYIFFSMSSW